MDLYLADWILDISDYSISQLMELRSELEDAVDKIEDRISELEKDHHIDESGK